MVTRLEGPVTTVEVEDVTADMAAGTTTDAVDLIGGTTTDAAVDASEDRTNRNRETGPATTVEPTISRAEARATSAALTHETVEAEATDVDLGKTDGLGAEATDVDLDRIATAEATGVDLGKIAEANVTVDKAGFDPKVPEAPSESPEGNPMATRTTAAQRPSVAHEAMTIEGGEHG